MMEKVAPPTDLERMSINGLELEYRWIPSSERWAPTMIFLHEGLGSAGLWRDFPDRVCKQSGCSGLVYSRQGHGYSTGLPYNDKDEVAPDAEYLKHEADEILPAVMDNQGIQRAILMGHSDGATIALMMAAANPDRVQGCIVEAPHVMVEEETIKGIRRAARAYASGDLRDGLSKYHADPAGLFQRWHKTWTHPAFQAWNMINRLSLIRCPVLGIQGEEDQYGSFAQLTTIRDGIAGHAEMVGLKRCNHTPHAEYPELVIESILKFLPYCR